MAAMVVLGRYEVTCFLHEGGMGRVYQARDKTGNRNVIVRVLPEKLSHDPKFPDMFRREMELLGRLRHPHLASVYESAPSTPHGPCIVSECVDGKTLSDLLQAKQRYSPSQVGKWLGQIGSALQYAHGLGVLHRNLTPASIVVANGGTEQEAVKVLDVGLAKPTLLTQLSFEKFPGLIRRNLGAPEYMSPEQARGEEIDRRSDIYSLGIILFELLAGQRPFRAATPLEWIKAHMSTPPATFEELNIRDVPPAIEFVVQRCLFKFVAERPHDAKEVVKAYQRALGEEIMLDEMSVQPPPEALSALSTVIRALPHGTVVYRMEAWMPESIAVVKLQGFLSGVGGEILENSPGLVRVRLPRRTPPPPPPEKGKSGFFGAVGGLVKKKSGVFGKDAPSQPPPPPPSAIHMKLYMERKDPNQPNLLSMALTLAPFEGNLIGDSEARAFCEKICQDICAYLMAKLVTKFG